MERLFWSLVFVAALNAAAALLAWATDRPFDSILLGVLVGVVGYIAARDAA